MAGSTGSGVNVEANKGLGSLLGCDDTALGLGSIHVPRGESVDRSGCQLLCIYIDLFDLTSSCSDIHNIYIARLDNSEFEEKWGIDSLE